MHYVHLPITDDDDDVASDMVVKFASHHPTWPVDLKLLFFMALSIRARRHYGRVPQVTLDYRFRFDDLQEAVMFKLRHG